MLLDRPTILEKFDGLTVWQRGGRRAPHKPLLVLLSIAEIIRTGRQFMPYEEAAPKLRALLDEFGVWQRNNRPQYPFWRLRNDGIWQLTRQNQLEGQEQAGGDISERILKENGAAGGFSDEIYGSMVADNSLAYAVARKVLGAHFPESIHEDILAAVGIDVPDAEYTTRRRVRDPDFRHRILIAYGYECAVCGNNVRLGERSIALEAAHIKWFQAGGPDREQNGIALCTMHHKLFDRGAFTISPDLVLKVSERINGKGMDEWLVRFHDGRIKSPIRPKYYPAEDFVNWHVAEVFQGPGRYQSISSME